MNLYAKFKKKISDAIIIGTWTFDKILLSPTKLRVYNKHTLTRFLNRPKGLPLITVTNHTSTLDDPVIWGALLDWKTVRDSNNLRFSLGAREIMFTNPLFSAFFHLGRTIPIDRGRGIHQEGMETAISKLKQGEWIHIFPEGKVNQVGKLLPLRWGVGKLIDSCSPPPVVIPIYHHGMDKLMPGGPGFFNTYIPRPWGKNITILVGKPIEVAKVIEHHKEIGSPKQTVYKALTDAVEKELQNLEFEMKHILELQGQIQDSKRLTIVHK